MSVRTTVTTEFGPEVQVMASLRACAKKSLKNGSKCLWIVEILDSYFDLLITLAIPMDSQE